MKQMIETKRTYARPQMSVVELKQRCCILADSGKKGGDPQSNMEDYINNGYYEE